MHWKSVRNNAPTTFERYWGKILIIAGLLSSLYFWSWLLQPQFAGYMPLYIVVIAAFMYKIFIRYIEWFFCFDLEITPKPEQKKIWTADVLTTYCAGEPKQMLYDTLEAVLNITYPHKTYLCDEANDPELKQYCLQRGIIHVTREKKVNAKAGNINNALYSVADGEICVILDPDHVPYPNFLDETLPYFEDPEVGYVQVVQAYYNQHSTIIAKAAAQQTYQYYGPFMMGLNSYGAVPAIGANCTFRRAALDSIGGHAAGLCEDMHTAMQLHAKGWKSIYNPVIVAKGLVPWNYSGYCLQQLKWSRGSFDLLFNELPQICRKLTWKQLSYYLSAPFFYLSGLISIFDFILPIIVLFTGIVPIKISVFDFLRHFFPLFIATFAIRQFNQRWLLERHERGAFIFGGTLMKASWWATFLGFFYSLIKKKVPYIPTPKDSRYETPIRLLIPNFVVIALSIAAIIYGLMHDFNPFMMFMAALAATNIAILSLGSLMSMQHLIIKVHAVFKGTFISKGSHTRIWISSKKNQMFGSFQVATIPMLAMLIGATYWLYKKDKQDMDELRSKTVHARQLFIPNIEGTAMADEDAGDADFLCDTIAYDSLFLAQAEAFHDKCLQLGKMPFITVALDSVHLAEFAWSADSSAFPGLFKYCKKSYIPIFLSVVGSGKRDSLTDSLLAACLDKIKTTADNNLFPNVAWVWYSESPATDKNIAPNKFFLSWICAPEDSAIAIIKQGSNAYSFRAPFLACKNGRIWSAEPSSDVRTEIDLSLFNNKTASIGEVQCPLPASFNGQIKGVAYNSGHDWRDNNVNLPLTREKLDADFTSIKSMGANTVRRYSPSIYDRNIIAAAHEHGLKVLYGFWFDPKTNYVTETGEIEDYKNQVTRFVRSHRDDTTILGWTLGNETWGIFKKHYNEPYLSLVRHQYFGMIQEIAQEIKQIDTAHPIFVAEEFTPHMPSALAELKRYVPSVDVYGINSYYMQNVSRLDSVVKAVCGTKPYLVSEFGPKGYWQHDYTDYFYGYFLYEQNSFSKAKYMSYQWDKYIEPHKGQCLGGVAFCWQDRFEATATWFGLTDLAGNRKPCWYAMQNSFSPVADRMDFPIPQFHLLMPNDIIWQDVTTTIIATTEDISQREEYLYKWAIYEELTFKKIIETPFTKGQYKFEFIAPATKAEYRLYLYVSEGKGNVITESHPLFISWH